MAVTRHKEADGRRLPDRRQGFTLVEVLVAVALLLILGGMELGTLRYGTDLWRAGQARSYCYDTATVVFHQLDSDVGAALSQFWSQDADAYDTRIRFVVDSDAPTGAPALRGPQQRLRFVAKIPDSTLNPVIRNAGTQAGGSVYNIVNGATNLVPLEGMCQVAYMMGVGQNDWKTLYRGVLAPITADPTQGLFPNNLVPTPGAGGNALPLTDNVVLYFEVRLWSQYTTTWAAAAPWTPWQNSWTPEYCGPAFQWDTNSTADVRTHVFPRAVMAVVVVEPPPSMRGATSLTLAANIGPASTTIPVSGPVPVYSTAWPYLLIEDTTNGNEWVRFTRFDAPSQSFVMDATDPLASRGMRGTTALNHLSGCQIAIGYTFSSAFYNPTGREYWGQ